MANNKGDGIAFATPRSSTWIVLNCILFVIVLDFCGVSIGDLTRDCLVFLKDRQVSRFGCFVFEFWVLRFRDLGASCFGLRFRVLRFRNYHFRIPFATVYMRYLMNRWKRWPRSTHAGTYSFPQLWFFQRFFQETALINVSNTLCKQVNYIAVIISVMTN